METVRPGNRYLFPAAVIVLILVVAIGAGLYLTRGGQTMTVTSISTVTASTGPSSSSGGSGLSTSTGSGTVINVVAAENFWGSLLSQLGGVHVNVTSIISDPNADPHEYEANSADSAAIANAAFVIVNGAGYDDWAIDEINANNSPHQTVLNVQQLINQSVDANPHFWYSPYYVNYTVAAMYKDLVKIDSPDKAYFTQQYSALNSSLYSSYMKQEQEIKQHYSGAPVASTESIFVYMANASGLDVVSPTGFMDAVAEGNDPSAQDVATFQNLLTGGNSTVNVLVYNQQTVTPLTQSIKSLAAQNQIPIIGVTETIQPPSYTFQFWMGAEVLSLQNALNSEALGQ